MPASDRSTSYDGVIHVILLMFTCFSQRREVINQAFAWWCHGSEDIV